MASKKIDIHAVLEDHAIHALILQSALPSIYVPEHIASGKCDARNIIDNHTWGTRGKSGAEPCHKVKLAECETEHLKNILRTQPQISTLTTLVIIAILMERNAFKKATV